MKKDEFRRLTNAVIDALIQVQKTSEALLNVFSEFVLAYTLRENDENKKRDERRDERED